MLDGWLVVACIATSSCDRNGGPGNGKGQMSMGSDNGGGWVRVTRGGGVHLGHVTKWGMMMMMIVVVVVVVEKGRSRFALTPVEGRAEVDG